MYNLSWHWWVCTVQCIQKHCLCVQYVKALNVKRRMWWWTRTMNGPALKNGLNFKSPFRRVQTELIRMCWYSERRPGPPCVLARIYGSSHVLRKSTLSPPPTPASFSPLSLKGADQFTASSGGVRLIPALCDWLRHHKPSVVRSHSLSPPRAISHGGQRPTLFTSGLCQPVARLRSKEITLIKPPPLLLPLSPTFSSSLVALSPLAHLK